MACRVEKSFRPHSVKHCWRSNFRSFYVCLGWGVPALPWILIGLVWVYNLMWMVVQDVVKLAIYRELNSRAKNQTAFLRHLKAFVHPRGTLYQQ